MSKPKLVRKFVGSDSFMLESASVIHGLATIDLADFTALNSGFTTAFLDLFKAQIDDASSILSDNYVVHKQATTTGIAMEALRAAQSKFQVAKGFIMDAFPNNRTIQNEFGLPKYNAARQNKEALAQLLEDLHRVATTKYAAELASVNCSAAFLDSLVTARTNLTDKTATQNVMKRSRPKLTEDRVAMLNTVYTAMMRINRWAQRVYEKDKVHAHIYIYSPPKRRKRKDKSSDDEEKPE